MTERRKIVGSLDTRYVSSNAILILAYAMMVPTYASVKMSPDAVSRLWSAIRQMKASDPMYSPDRIVVILAGLTVLLFQTHWLDDLDTNERDVMGITVSAVGSALLLSGLLLWKHWSGRALLVLGFLSVAFVSAADLRGVNAEGAFAPDVMAHWRETLGWCMTLAVASTLLSSVAGVVVVISAARRLQTPRPEPY